MSTRLEGRVAVVTGAATGIGRAYALRLAEEGADIAILDVADASETVAAVTEKGRRAVAVRVDLTDHDGVIAAAAEVGDALGAADILINNAGIYPNQPLADMQLADWQRMMAINVQSMFSTIQAFTPAMKEKGRGRVVNMTSNSVHLVIGGFTHYVASKMAVIGLTRGAATELAEFGITVNAVGPSLVRTATTEAGPAVFFDVVPQMQAIKRAEEPADLVGTIAFLASDDAAFLTGQTIWVDGGLVRAG